MLNLKTSFPEIYIEINAREMFKGRGGQVSIFADQEVGYFSTNQTVMSMTDCGEGIGKQEGINFGVIPSPWTWTFSQPQQRSIASVFGLPIEQLDRAQMLKAVYLLGGQRSPKNKNKVWLPPVDDQLIADLVNKTDLSPIFDMDAERCHEHCFLGGGDPMIFAAAVMMLNERSEHTIIMEKSASRMMYKGKSVAIPEHSTVSVHFDKKEHTKVRYLITSHPGSPKREHDVRGHWCYYGEQGDCEHVWTPLTPDNTKQYVCHACKGRKTWRIPHSRGDAALGRVDKIYIVKK